MTFSDSYGEMYIETLGNLLSNYKEVRFQYDIDTRLLNIWYVPYELENDLTISSITVANSADTWTLEDNEGTTLSLPLTIPAGTAWNEGALFKLVMKLPLAGFGILIFTQMLVNLINGAKKLN